MTKLGAAVVNENYGVDEISIKVPFDEDFLDVLKSRIPASGREWDRDEKLWIITEKHAKKAILLVSEFFNIEYS